MNTNHVGAASVSGKRWWPVIAFTASMASSCSMTKQAARDATWSLPSHAAFLESTERVDCDLPFEGRKFRVHAVRRRCTGPKKVGTLVFVHGYPASLFTWTDVIASPAEDVEDAGAWDRLAEVHKRRSMSTLGMHDLASRFDLLALDLPGHGFTSVLEGPPVGDTIRDPRFAAAFLLMAVTELAGEGPVILVGHSFGALVCCYAVDHWCTTDGRAAALNLQGLALIDPEGVYRSEAEMLPGEVTPWLLRRHGVARFLGELIDWLPWGWDGTVNSQIQAMSLVERPVPRDQREAYSLNQKVAENYYTSQYLAQRARGEDIATIRRVGGWNKKVAILWGAADALFPAPKHPGAFQRWFERGAKHGRSMNIVAGAGHIVPEDAPGDVVAWLLEAFAKR